MDSIWNTIGQHISDITGTVFSIQDRRVIGGGCINTAYVVRGNGADYFVKLNSADRLEMFAAESAGLTEIVSSNTVRAPHPVCHGAAESASYIVMEYIPSGTGDKHSCIKLGQQLAAMHRITREQFGWKMNNTIGATPQINTRNRDWIEFWREHRLGYQLKLVAQKGYGRQLIKADQLLERFPALFSNYKPRPSLLHGDLWSGNYAVDKQGIPFIFDPAVYFGDREADIAMTELFGGFPAQFYSAYQDSFPLDAGYPARKNLYNLYHILNHVNLFDGGYLSQARQLIDQILSDI